MGEVVRHMGIVVPALAGGSGVQCRLCYKWDGGGWHFGGSGASGRQVGGHVQS
jgi:hypothetical protein